jgi:predicted HD phosphohydrolase
MRINKNNTEYQTLILAALLSDIGKITKGDGDRWNL